MPVDHQGWKNAATNCVHRYIQWNCDLSGWLVRVGKSGAPVRVAEDLEAKIRGVAGGGVMADQVVAADLDSVRWMDLAEHFIAIATPSPRRSRPA